MTDPPRSQSDRDELRSYLRTNLTRAVVGLVLLSAALVLVGALYEQELIAIANRVYASLGVAGLLAVLFLTDAIFSPMPPDVVLVVIANSTLHPHWPILLPVIGVLSAIAGLVGWFIGSYFARIRWAAPYVARIRIRYERPIQRFDRWAVVLGAITPIPFSLVCISAGALGMRFARLAPITLLRIPRFAIFYWVIYYSTAG